MEKKIWAILLTTASIVIILAALNLILYSTFISPDHAQIQWMKLSSDYVQTMPIYTQNNGREIKFSDCNKFLSGIEPVSVCNLEFLADSTKNPKLVDLYTISVFIKDSKVTNIIHSAKTQINNFEDCKLAGFQVYDPQCYKCALYCTDDEDNKYYSKEDISIPISFTKSKQISSDYIDSNYQNLDVEYTDDNILDCPSCYEFIYSYKTEDSLIQIPVQVKEGYIFEQDKIISKLTFEQTLDFDSCMDAGGEYIRPSCSCKKPHCLLNGTKYYK
jgi:hypothetical protein